jgi:hypothetical protein
MDSPEQPASTQRKGHLLHIAIVLQLPHWMDVAGSARHRMGAPDGRGFAPPPITDHPLGEPKALPILPRAFDPLGHRVHPPPALPKSCAVVQRLCERRALLDAPSLQ